MTTYQPPYSFFYWRQLLLRKKPPISLHIHSSTEGCCCTENDHLSASIFIHLLEAVVAQKMTTYQPPYSFIYWRQLLHRKKTPISLHIHSSTGGCCCIENDHLSASIFILLLEAVVAQKMTTYQPPYSFIYWRLLLHRKWPPISLHIHSSTGDWCCSENDHLSASIFIHLLKTVVAQKMTTDQPPYSFFYWKAVVAQKMTTYQPPYSFIYWRQLLLRKKTPISLHIHSSTGRLLLHRKWPPISLHIHSSNGRLLLHRKWPPISLHIHSSTDRLLLLRKWPPISLHIHSSNGGCCCTENDHLSASIFIHLLEAVVAQKMTTNQPPYSFF